MTIDEDIEMLEYIRQDFRGCRQGVALEDSIDTMHKYQKIEQILDDCDLEAWEILEKVKEVIEDGRS